MSSCLNRATIVGYVGHDPEVRTFNDGNRSASFSVATNETWVDKASGERTSRTEWHRVVIRAPGLIDVVSRYVRKGDRIFVEGALQTRQWKDQYGGERTTTEIVVKQIDGRLLLLGGKADGAGAPAAAAPRPSSRAPAQTTAPAHSPAAAMAPADGGGRPASPELHDELNDEIPF
jgi:single-strand DNA-binding protein